MVLVAVLIFCTKRLSSNSLYLTVISTVSTLAEAQLAVPQLVQNFKKGSTKGLSKVLVMMWVAGDVYKFYFYWANA